MCRAVRVCRPPVVDATTQPHDASYVPFAGAPGTVSAPTRSAARLFAGATCDGLTRRSAWFLHRDMRTRAGETAPGTGRSWVCSSGCTTCADDKVAKRPHATRNGPAKFKFVFGSAPDGCGDGGKTGDAVGRDVGTYVGTLLVGTLVGV